VLDVQADHQSDGVGDGCAKGNGDHRRGHQLGGAGAGGLAEPVAVSDRVDHAGVLGAVGIALFHQLVGLGDDAHQPAGVVDDRQGADVVLLQQPHQLVEGGGGPCGDDLAGHNGLDRMLHGDSSLVP